MSLAELPLELLHRILNHLNSMERYDLIRVSKAFDDCIMLIDERKSDIPISRHGIAIAKSDEYTCVYKLKDKNVSLLLSYATYMNILSVSKLRLYDKCIDDTLYKYAYISENREILTALLCLRTPSCKFIKLVCQGGDISTIKLILALYSTNCISKDLSDYISGAYHGGHMELVKILVNLNNDRAFIWACDKGYTDIVQMILPYTNYEGFKLACKHNHVDIARLIVLNCPMHVVKILEHFRSMALTLSIDILAVLLRNPDDLLVYACLFGREVVLREAILNGAIITGKMITNAINYNYDNIVRILIVEYDISPSRSDLLTAIETNKMTILKCILETKTYNISAIVLNKKINIEIIKLLANYGLSTEVLFKQAILNDSVELFKISYDCMRVISQDDINRMKALCAAKLILYLLDNELI